MEFVSTRTPEGEPLSCPVCRGEALAVPSAFPTADVPCPRCGHLLWASGDPSCELHEPCDPLQAMAVSIQRGAELWRELEQRLPPEVRASQLDLTVSAGRLDLCEITDAAEVSVVESLFAAGDEGRW